MAPATELPTDMSGWAPVTRHYQVPDGYLAVTVLNFLTAKGTQVLECNEEGIASSMTPLAAFPDGTSAEDALLALGYELDS